MFVLLLSHERMMTQLLKMSKYIQVHIEDTCEKFSSLEWSVKQGRLTHTARAGSRMHWRSQREVRQKGFSIIAGVWEMNNHDWNLSLQQKWIPLTIRHLLFFPLKSATCDWFWIGRFICPWYWIKENSATTKFDWCTASMEFPQANLRRTKPLMGPLCSLGWSS